MKILCAYHPAHQPGGITNHQEVLSRGFLELGHSVTMRCLYWSINKSGRSEPSRSLTQELGVNGMQFDQKAGWFWPTENCFPYRDRIPQWKEYASGFDLVIWQIPVPGKRNDTEGNYEWPELYDIPTKQLAIIHDGNIERYPWVYQIADKLTGLVGVHPCGFAGARNVAIRSTLIPNPHWQPLERAKKAARNGRSGWASVQTFKEWKHVDDILRAAPYMQGSYAKSLAGGGIEYYYMTSPDKVKDKYLARKSVDPDLPNKEEGSRIWNRALDHGVKFYGYLSNSERDELLSKAKYLIDPSWSKKYSQAGDHFNRTPIEGIIAGCVPIARNLGIADNEEGEGVLFSPGENYHMIPWDATPKFFGGTVDNILAQPESRRLQMLEAGWEILPCFDALSVAQAYIDFAKGKKPAGALAYCPKGVVNATMLEETKKAMEGHFARH